jgi:hypothetical protein
MTSYNTMQTFNFVSNAQIFIIPVQVFQIFVVLYGASGGLPNSGANEPGYGAKVSSTLNVIPGSTLYLYTGGRGSIASGSNPLTCYGGFNGGGDGISGAGGGGATDIRNGTELKNRIVTAAGGGGAYWSTCTSANGGNGGIPNGYSGDRGSCSAASTSAGSAGTQTTFGTNPSFPTLNGAFGQGGTGASSSLTSGGGGGGYYGE